MGSSGLSGTPAAGSSAFDAGPRDVVGAVGREQGSAQLDLAARDAEVAHAAAVQEVNRLHAGGLHEVAGELLDLRQRAAIEAA